MNNIELDQVIRIYSEEKTTDFDLFNKTISKQKNNNTTTTTNNNNNDANTNNTSSSSSIKRIESPLPVSPEDQNLDEKYLEYQEDLWNHNHEQQHSLSTEEQSVSFQLYTNGIENINASISAIISSTEKTQNRLKQPKDYTPSTYRIENVQNPIILFDEKDIEGKQLLIKMTRKHFLVPYKVWHDKTQMGNQMIFVSRYQYPFTLYEAITSHSGQGLTINLKSPVHIKHIFAKGQLYSMLTRFPTSKNIQLFGFKDMIDKEQSKTQNKIVLLPEYTKSNHFKNDFRVIQFYKELNNYV
jgi:hypothetical protein